MTTPYLNGGGFSFQLESVGGRWSWSVITNNIYGANQVYYVRDILSPFGPINQVQTPIPSNVIAAMNDSINSLKTQLQPNLAIASGSVISAVVSEGDSVLYTDGSVVSNNGALGSFMSVAAFSDSPWLTPRPTSFNSLGQGQSATLSAAVNPSLLVSDKSPYVGHILLTDNAVNPHTASVEYNITVLPRPTFSINYTSILFEYNITTGSVTSPINVTVTNSGPPTSVLNYYITRARNMCWVRFNPANGGPLQCGEYSQVQVGVDSANAPRADGTYTETLVFNSQNATNNPVILNVTLVVNQ